MTNVENRKLYDQYGVWPPPTAVDDTPQAGPSYTHEPFSGFAGDPFFGRSRPMRGFAFTDPFELFNSLFGDIHRAFSSDPFFDDFPMPRSPFESIFGPSPLRSRRDDFFGSPFGSIGFGGGHPLIEMMNGGLGGGNVRSYSSVSQAIGSNGKWVSQSQVTRTINGRTETIITRRDAQGNEHVTYSSPEGERYTINGIEQAPQNDKYLPPSQQQPPSVSAPPPPPAINYSSHPGSSSHNYYAAPQQLPVNYANHQPQAASYSVPIHEPAQQYVQAPPVSRHSSHSSGHHHASRMRGGADEDVRRSSSRHRTDYERQRDRTEPAYADRSHHYEHDAPRRSTSSRHSRHDKHAEPPRHDKYAEPPRHERYSEPPRQEPGAKYGAQAGGYPNGYSNGYANGYANGTPNNYANGATNGHTNGHTNGYANGYAEPPRSTHGPHKHRWAHGW